MYFLLFSITRSVCAETSCNTWSPFANLHGQEAFVQQKDRQNEQQMLQQFFVGYKNLFLWERQTPTF
jgi:hypothetical protein